jgi:hydroxypyruvate isomerase
MAELTRREALVAGVAAISAGLPAVAQGQGTAPAVAVRPQQRAVTKGRLKQSVSRWCYQRIPMPDFCKAVSELGLTAIDLLEEPEWAVARDHG